MEQNRCPICLESWEEGSYMMPCLHQFCYQCILRWAKSKPECPLCKRRITSILHSVQGDDKFEEHVFPSPAAAPVLLQLTAGAPGHPATDNIHHPAASQPSAAGLVPWGASLGSLHPRSWALRFRGDPSLPHPVMPWLQWELQLIFEGGHWETLAAQRLIVSSLRLFGLNRQTLFHLLQATLGPHTGSFVRRLIDIIMRRCSGEARRRMGLEGARAAGEREGSPAGAPGPAAPRNGSPAPRPAPSSSPDRVEAEELPSTSSAALRGGPGSPPSAPIPTHGEQEELQQDPEEAVPGPSAPSRGSERSPGEPWQALKRRASDPEEPSQPPKKLPHL